MALGPNEGSNATLAVPMNRRLLALGLPFFVLLVSAACGDGNASEATPTVKPSPTSAAPADGFGPAPVLGDNILKVSPAHAAQVKRAATITTNQLSPKGVCVEVSFEGLPTTGQAFRFIVDEQDVTAGGDTVWKVDSATAPKNGTLCYSPKAGLTVGIHSAAVGVQDSTNVQAPFKQVVAWKFEVTE